MVDIFSLMYSVQGFTEEEGRERAVKIFETLDKNGDGSLCEDEFIKVMRSWLVSRLYSVLCQGCMLDSELLDMLNGSPCAGNGVPADN